MSRASIYRRILYPLQEFVRAESFGGILLLITALVAIAWANSPWQRLYTELWSTPVSIGFGAIQISRPVLFWINEGLMTLFYLVLGLEIKRELLSGELSSFRLAAFPLSGAIGGFILAAISFVYFNPSWQSSPAFTVPVATDLALGLGILSLHGNKVPLSLKLFFIACGISDNLLALLVAIGMNISSPEMFSLSVAFLAFGILLVISAMRWNNLLLYLSLGFVMWLAFVVAGISATMVGLFLTLTIPIRPKLYEDDFINSTDTILGELHASHYSNQSEILRIAPEDYQAAMYTIKSNCQAAMSPLYRLEHWLHPWVANLILPVFILANTGLLINASLTDGFYNNLTWGLAVGYLLGKPIGILLFAALIGLTKIAPKPKAYTWLQLLGICMLGGIGFTVGIFNANLSFVESDLLPQVKLAVLAASVVAGFIGFLIIFFSPAPRVHKV